MIGFTLRLWSCRWGLLRFALAAFICWVLAADTAARMARLQLAALPDFDYRSEVHALRVQGRFGEAEVIARAGLDSMEPGATRDALDAELKATVEERDSWLRKAKSAGMGALSGRGTDLESLVGAVAADFFVVGDVRDLVIEGGKQLVDGDSDELVLLLSFAGVVTTLAPEIDWAPSVIKAARRSGQVSVRMTEYLTSALKARRGEQVAKVCEDVARVSKKASPGGAMRLLRLAEEPEDLAKIARFVERSPAGAFAMHVTGKEGAAVLKGATESTAKASEELIVAAARKGQAGTRFLSTPAARALTRPHLILGLAKTFWKGNAEALITRLTDRFDQLAWWGMPLAAAWAVLEGLLLLGRLSAPSPAAADAARRGKLRSA